MRILLIHNYTQDYAPGGEAFVFEEEVRQLRERGVEVHTWVRTNSEALRSSLLTKFRYYVQSPWSRSVYREMMYKLHSVKPDIVHVHNFFMVLSPSLFAACSDFGVRVVVTLHNYRFVTPCSQFILDGKPCLDCLGKNPWRILVRRCYRDSFWPSLLRYRFYYMSDQKNHWKRLIAKYIALSESQKKLLVLGGLDSKKIIVKGNSLADPLQGRGVDSDGYGAVFAGRLSTEKGVKVLLKAWEGIEYPLKIIGDGCLYPLVECAAVGNPWITVMGSQDRNSVIQEFKKCSFVLVPSIWYEPFGLVNIEAMAVGKPVVAAKIGAMSTIVNHGQTGLLYQPGDSNDLRNKVMWLLENRKSAAEMGRCARNEYIAKYSPPRNVARLLAIYEDVLRRCT